MPLRRDTVRPRRCGAVAPAGAGDGAGLPGLLPGARPGSADDRIRGGGPPPAAARSERPAAGVPACRVPTGGRVPRRTTHSGRAGRTRHPAPRPDVVTHCVCGPSGTEPADRGRVRRRRHRVGAREELKRAAPARGRAGRFIRRVSHRVFATHHGHGRPAVRHREHTRAGAPPATYYLSAPHEMIVLAAWLTTSPSPPPLWRGLDASPSSPSSETRPEPHRTFRATESTTFPHNGHAASVHDTTHSVVGCP